MSLFEACQKRNIDKIKSLIEQKVRIFSLLSQDVFKSIMQGEVDEQGRTALHYCSDHENTDCAEILLEDKSVLNLQDNQGYSALYLGMIREGLMRD
jgi:ankyrin repeat protein